MNKLDPDQVPYMSHSKVTTVERCPRCYYRQYVLREKMDGDWVVVGNLFHKAARFFYGALASGVELPE